MGHGELNHFSALGTILAKDRAKLQRHIDIKSMLSRPAWCQVEVSKPELWREPNHSTNSKTNLPESALVSKVPFHNHSSVFTKKASGLTMAMGYKPLPKSMAKNNPFKDLG